MKFIRPLIFVFALCLEIIAAKMLFSYEVAATFIHMLAALLLTFFCYIFLQQNFKNVGFFFLLLMFLFSFFIPFAGFLFASFVVLMLYQHRKQFYKYAEYKKDVTNLSQMSPVHSTYGPGGAYLKAFNTDASTESRTDALFMLGQSRFSDSNRLMFQLLSDESDEIRLLAFKILEQQESFIVDEIRLITDLLENDELTAGAKAKFEKSIAMLYWELAYRSLVAHELLQAILKKSLSHALEALKVLQDDASLWALIGKIYSRLNESKKAEDAFSKTIKFNIPLSQVYPYLAAIKFKNRDFLAVKKYLEPEPLKDISLVAKVKYFWEAK